MKVKVAALLRSRMLLVALLPVTVVVLGLTSLLLNRHFIDLNAALEQRGVALARQAATGSEFAIFSGNNVLLEALTQNLLRTDPDVVSALVMDNAGKILAQSGDQRSLSGHQSATRYQAKEVIDRHADETIVTVPVEPVLLPINDVYSDIVAPDSNNVRGMVVVVLSHQRLDNQRAEIISIALILACFGIGLGGFLALALARGIIRPLLEATKVVARIGSGELGARMSHSGSGPLDPLAAGINAMAWRLDRMQDDLRAQVAKATDGLRQQKEAAESATIAKSRFLAAASHDLRQPLHALGLFVSRLSGVALPRQHGKLVAHIEESVNSLQMLLEDLLDLSRLDLKEIVPVVEEFDAEEMLWLICQDLSSIAERKELDLRLHESRNGLQQRSRVISDPRLVERVMRNLIGNALTYTDTGTVLVTARRRGSHLRLAVWDTGCGIPAERQVDIFQEYVQIGNDERDRSKGLGLGLSICHHVATALKTTIGLCSRPGRGSVFWIDLPLSGAAMRPDPVSPATAAENLPAAKVLVVGKDSIDRQLITKTIHAWGGEALCAPDLETALQLCRDQRPLMAICDSQEDMPLGGVIIGEELRRENPSMAILLVVSIDVSVKSVARNAGFPLLPKPVQAGRIRAALQQMSGGGGALSRRHHASTGR